jgi:hypothetical protein
MKTGVGTVPWEVISQPRRAAQSGALLMSLNRFVLEMRLT